MMRTYVLAGLAGAMLCAPAHALTYHFDEASFLVGAGGGIVTNDLDGAGLSNNQKLTTPIDFGPFTIATRGDSAAIVSGADAAVRFILNSGNHFGRFTFDAPVFAFGFTMETPSNRAVDVEINGVETRVGDIAGAGFFGVTGIAGGTTEILFTRGSGDANFIFDDVQFSGQAVNATEAIPLPAPLVLLLGGLGVLGFLSRRRGAA